MTHEKSNDRFIGWFCIGLAVLAVAVVAGISAYSREAYLLALMPAALASLVPGIVLLRRKAVKSTDET